MSEKIYQIFVSSTYTDLVEERKMVIETIIAQGHMPAGMENFSAADEEQFEYIKRVIDNCDYYVLILGGRYGSDDTPTGKSYTEMEYEYAKSRGIPILVFPLENIEELPIPDKRDSDLTKINEFRDKAMKSTMARPWADKIQLQRFIPITISNVINDKPMQGWQRYGADKDKELLTKIISLQEKNNELSSKIKTMAEEKSSAAPDYEDLADLDEIYSIEYYVTNEDNERVGYSAYSMTWEDIALSLLPKLVSSMNYNIFYNSVKTMLELYFDEHGYVCFPTEDAVNTIKFQLLAYKFIEIDTADNKEQIRISKNGMDFLKSKRTVKTNKKQAVINESI